MFFYPCKRLLSSLFVLVWRHSFRHSPTHSSFCSFLLICLSWFGLFINLLVDQTMISAFATILPALYSEQSLLFFRVCEVSARARASERSEKRGRRPEKKKRVASPFSCLSHLVPSVTRVVICVSCAFCSTHQQKRETVRSLALSQHFVLTALTFLLSFSCVSFQCFL